MGKGKAPGVMFVTFDDPYVESGGQLTGTVNLRLSKNFVAKQLVLKITGLERVQWTEKCTKQEVKDGKTKTVKFNKTRSKDQHIIDFEAIVTEWGEKDKLKSGDYSWPF